MSNIAYVGTSQGKIVKVVAGVGGSQTVVLASPTTTRAIQSLVLTPGAQSHIFADQQIPSSNNMRLFTSTDSGATWATGLFTAGGGSSPSGFYPDGLSNGMGRLEDDTLLLVDYFFPTNHEWIVHSTDGGVTWQTVFAPPATTNFVDGRMRWYQKGKFWYLAMATFPILELRSILPDGSDFQNPVVSSFTNLNLEGTRRDTGTNIMFLVYTAPAAQQLTVVNISTPDSPVVTQITNLPNLFAPPYMVPHTDTTWFAVWTTAIYRTTDAGASWNLIFAPGGFVFSGNGGRPAIATSDTNDVFVLGHPNDKTIFYSPDLGDTWETISLAGTIGSAQALTLVTPNSGVVAVPGVSGFDVNGAQLFFVTTVP